MNQTLNERTALQLVAPRTRKEAGIYEQINDEGPGCIRGILLGLAISAVFWLFVVLLFTAPTWGSWVDAL